MGNWEEAIRAWERRRVTDRDRARLQGVHPLLVQKITVVLQAMPMFVVQGVRTLEQQAQDYLQGRAPDHPGPIVTYCDGVTHKGPHQPHADGFGYAVDLAFLPSPSMADPFDHRWPWDEFGDAVENQGLMWGGRFHSGHMGDLDHAELPLQPTAV